MTDLSFIVFLLFLASAQNIMLMFLTVLRRVPQNLFFRQFSDLDQGMDYLPRKELDISVHFGPIYLYLDRSKSIYEGFQTVLNAWEFSNRMQLVNLSLHCLGKRDFSGKQQFICWATLVQQLLRALFDASSHSILSSCVKICLLHPSKTGFSSCSC